MKEHAHGTSICFLLPIQKTLLTLTGKRVEGLSGDEVSRIVKENKNPRQVLILVFHKLYMSLLFDSDDSAVQECCEAFIGAEQTNATSYLIMFSDATHVFYSGLASYQVYRKTKEMVWIERGKSCKEKMKHFNEQGCTRNFQHKIYLLEAEEDYCNGNFRMAHEFYQKAIKSARAHKFINEEALACELAAKFYLDTRDSALSLEHFTLAHEKYHEWGAFEKANWLFRYTREKISNSFVVSGQYNSSSAGFVTSPALFDGQLKRLHPR
jgi:hypothetical protein